MQGQEIIWEQNKTTSERGTCRMLGHSKCWLEEGKIEINYHLVRIDLYTIERCLNTKDNHKITFLQVIAKETHINSSFPWVNTDKDESMVLTNNRLLKTKTIISTITNKNNLKGIYNRTIVFSAERAIRIGKDCLRETLKTHSLFNNRCYTSRLHIMQRWIKIAKETTTIFIKRCQVNLHNMCKEYKCNNPEGHFNTCSINLQEWDSQIITTLPIDSLKLLLPLGGVDILIDP